MKFMFIGDTHFGKMDKIMGAGVGLQRQVKLFESQLSIARAHRINHIALLGDIFDNPYPTQEQLVAVLKLLSSPFRFLVYFGNHDYEDSTHNSLRLLRELPAAGALTNVTFVREPRIVEWCGARVYVMPWAPRYTPLRERCDLVLFHDDLVGAKRDTGMMIPQGDGISRTFFRGITAVSGHLHTPQKVGNIFFTGTAAQLSFGERPEKRIFFGEMTSGGIRITNQRFDSPWRLETSTYHMDDPPPCNEQRTFYSLDVSHDRPGPKWLSEHPNVVKVRGSNRKLQQQLTEKVAELSSGVVADDGQLLYSWLRQNTSLSKGERKEALRIDRKLGERHG